jgi:hypothetical protein
MSSNPREKTHKYRRSSTLKKRKGGKWTRKYKKSINCSSPKGFSQKQYCKYGRRGGGEGDRDTP